MGVLTDSLNCGYKIGLINVIDLSSFSCVAASLRSALFFFRPDRDTKPLNEWIIRLIAMAVPPEDFLNKANLILLTT